MSVVIGFLILFVLVVAHGVGVAIANSGSPANRERPGPMPDSEDCRSACARWDNARQSLCNSKSDEAAAVIRADGARARFVAESETATALGIAAGVAWVLVAVAAASGIGAIAVPALTFIAGVASVVASAAAIKAAVTSGELAVAEDDIRRKARVRREWEQEVSNARLSVNQKCTPAEANACLNRTSPC